MEQARADAAARAAKLAKEAREAREAAMLETQHLDLGRVESSSAWRRWLADNQLEHFERKFEQQLGITDVGDFKFVTAADLHTIGMSGPKMRRFLHAAKST